jgi:hypothetical protein
MNAFAAAFSLFFWNNANDFNDLPVGAFGWLIPIFSAVGRMAYH